MDGYRREGSLVMKGYDQCGVEGIQDMAECGILLCLQAVHEGLLTCPLDLSAEVGPRKTTCAVE
jgi:hypothetical protein